MKRDSRIELLRIFLMFGIVMLHCAQETIGSSTWERNICKWCVDGFALITGYFGISRFSFKKVSRLYVMAIVCLLMIECARFFHPDESGACFSLREVWHCFCDLWFLHAYVLLMLMAPFVNLAAESRHRFEFLVPFCAVILVWGLLGELPVIGKVMFKTSGVESLSGLTLLVAYAVGRLYRICGWQVKIKPWWVYTVLPVLLFICCFGIHNPKNGDWNSGWFGSYSSPFAVVTAVCFLHIFNRMVVPKSLERLILLVSPSMFPVYVLHLHPVVFERMTQTGRTWTAQFPDLPALLVLASITFVFCIGIDLLRRAVVMSFCGRNHYAPSKRNLG